MKKLLLVIVMLAMPALLWAQVVGDSCQGPPSAPQTVPSGAPFTFTWTMAQLVPKSDTDPTLVPHRYSGFVIVLDGGAPTDIGLPTSTGVCPNGTARAGDKMYEYKWPGVPRGQHNANFQAWNPPCALGTDGQCKLNPDGTPVWDDTKRQYGVTVSVPFDGVDVTDPTRNILLGPPYGVFNVWITKPGVAATKAPVKK